MVALNIIGQEIPAVTLGPLAVLGVVVSVSSEYQHQSMVYYSTVQVPANDY